MVIKTKIKLLFVLVVVIGGASFLVMRMVSPTCPTSANFVEKFNNWSVGFLDGNPTYGEKEQREGWQKHLEEMGCIESQDIIDNATYGGKTSDYE